MVLSNDIEVITMTKAEKTDNWDKLIALIKERERHFKGKMEKTDHDLILYGASRNDKEGKERKL